MIPFPSEETTPPVTKIYFVSTLIINFFAKIVQGERKTKSSLLEILIFRAAACVVGVPSLCDDSPPTLPLFNVVKFDLFRFFNNVFFTLSRETERKKEISSLSYGIDTSNILEKRRKLCDKNGQILSHNQGKSSKKCTVLLEILIFRLMPCPNHRRTHGCGCRMSACRRAGSNSRLTPATAKGRSGLTGCRRCRT